MAVSGAAVAYCAAGGLVLYSGIKGATLADTARSVLAGNLNLSDTETVDFSSDTTASGAAGSGTSAASGSSSQNYITIAKYLVANGYSNAGAAGVAGCIAGESGGNPEDKGSDAIGLIQWTGSNEAEVPPLTGNATKDLDAQLPAIVAYNNAQGVELVNMLNQISDPVQAADFYSQYFERPAVKDSDVVASVAQSVYAALAKGSG